MPGIETLRCCVALRVSARGCGVVLLLSSLAEFGLVASSRLLVCSAAPWFMARPAAVGMARRGILPLQSSGGATVGLDPGKS